MVESLMGTPPAGSGGDEPLAVDLATAAKRIGCSPRTLKGYIDRDDLRAFQMGRQWRVRVSELNAFMRKLEQRAAAKRPAVARPRESHGRFTSQATPLFGK